MSGATERAGAWATLRRGLALSPELRRGLGGTVLLAAAATTGKLVVPVTVQQILDREVLAPGGPDVGRVALLVLGAGLVVGLAALASRAMAVRLVTVTESALSSLRVRTFRHVHDLSTLHLAEEHRGALVARVTSDIDQISRFMQWGGVALLVNGLQLVLAVVVMAVYSWQLTVVVLVVFGPLVPLLRWFQRRLSLAYDGVREWVARMLTLISESVVGAEVVRAYGFGGRIESRIAAAVEGHFHASFRAARISVAMSSMGELFAGAATGAVVVVGVWLGVAGVLTPDGTPWLGQLVAFLFLITLFVAPAHLAVEVLDQAQAAIAGWRRVLAVLDTVPDVAAPTDGGVALPPGRLGVALAGVGFRYPRAEVVREDRRAVSMHQRGQQAAPSVRLVEDPRGAWALRDVTVEIAPGTQVAVVGETGSGKTTLAKLVLRLMDPTVGVVRIGGVPTARIAPASYRRRVATVPQDGFLFAGTVADNVRAGEPTLDDAGVAAVFADLGLASWVAGLTRGVATRVGERGSGLSTGERQLVALARAAAVDPDLLVLDEATSAVDPATEVRIQSALERLSGGRTTLTIAHRLSTAERADLVLVIDGGRLVQSGTHAELVGREGPYAALHASWRRRPAVS